ncbi:aromatic amino acid lyase [Rathayibacter soli]|uniref:aromatic amino acid lyase n=1 Tax=Rathayibacter soli TaxID=3144168 RepID=UPI0027E4E282|nr:aromatic amino acid lyase [Glaciibacter superstes]
MIEFDGEISVADIVSVARDHEHPVVPDATRQRVRHMHDHAQELAARVPTYGRTTGVGANRTTSVDTTDAEHGLRLLRSHAIDAGNPLPAVAVRAMLAVRLAQLSIPGSGIQVDILDGVQRMLDTDALPTVLEFNSVGTADLAALAGTALTLMGERPATAPLQPMPRWSTDSALPFMSSSALTIGRACLVIDELRALSRASIVVFGLSFTALRGNPSPFSQAAAIAGASPQLVPTCATLRTIVGDADQPARIQDPYALRAFPLTLAPAADALDQLETIVIALTNTAQENPLFTNDAVIHHGGFHQVALALKADTLAIALAAQTPVTLSRIRLMSEPDYTGMRPFLAAGQPGSSGIMMVEYVAGAAIGDLHASAQPASLTTVSLSRGTEEDASFAPLAISQLERSVRALRILLACEALIAVRVLRQQGASAADLPSETLASAWNVLQELPADDHDRDLRPDLELAQNLLDRLGDLV